MPLPLIIPIVAAAASIGSSAYSAIKAAQDRKKAQAESERQLRNMPVYQTPEALKNLYAESQAGKSAVSPVIATQERALQQAQANMMANAQRAATSGAESLSIGAKAQSLAQAALPQLAETQEAYRQAALKRADMAAMGMTEDAQIKYEADVARQASFINYALGKAAAASQRQAQATAGAIQGASNLLSSYAQNPDAFSFGNKTATTPVVQPMQTIPTSSPMTAPVLSSNYQAIPQMGYMPQAGASIYNTPAFGGVPYSYQPNTMPIFGLGY